MAETAETAPEEPPVHPALREQNFLGAPCRRVRVGIDPGPGGARENGAQDWPLELARGIEAVVRRGRGTRHLLCGLTRRAAGLLLHRKIEPVPAQRRLDHLHAWSSTGVIALRDDISGEILYTAQFPAAEQLAKKAAKALGIKAVREGSADDFLSALQVGGIAVPVPSGAEKVAKAAKALGHLLLERPAHLKKA